MGVARVIVGVDGSQGSMRALRWAADEAAARHVPLHPVLSWEPPELRWAPGIDPAKVVDPQADADATLASILASIELDVDVPVEPTASLAAPAAALLELARPDDLLVVGARGSGGFHGLHLGSVGERVAQHAPCPVVVVRTSEDEVAGWWRPRRIVVGVDGSETAAAALAWALDEARLHLATIDVIHTWEPVLTGPAMATAPVGLEVLEHAAKETLTEVVERSDLHGLEGAVRPAVAMGSAAGALVERSHEANLVVVGSRGRGRVAGLLLGSTSSQVVRHAACPVVVVHRPPPAGFARR